VKKKISIVAKQENGSIAEENQRMVAAAT